MDSLAINIVGAFFKRFPSIKQVKLSQWRASENFWLRRTCILFQNRYKINPDFDLLKEIIRENLGSEEFFINKAIGWSLREYSKVNAPWVRDFLLRHADGLSALSRKEASKYL